MAHQQQIPPAAIAVDPQGETTRLTAQHTLSLMEAHHWQRAIVISQFFHITRAKLALRQVGVPLVGGAHAQYIELRDLYATLREGIALYVYGVQYGWR